MVVAAVMVVTAEEGGAVEIGMEPVVVSARSELVQAATEPSTAMASNVRRFTPGAYNQL